MYQRESEEVDGRSEAEKREFGQMLGAIADLYLTASVLILLDNTYFSRFWTLLEAWCAMLTATSAGVRLSLAGAGSVRVCCALASEEKEVSGMGESIKGAVQGSAERSDGDRWLGAAPAIGDRDR